MPEYRRNRVPGGTFFFTLITFNRRPLFSSEQNCQLLMTVWKDVQSRHPFESIVSCILPDHIHAVWKLPEGDDDYPLRWKEIKRLFTQEYNRNHEKGMVRSQSQQIQGESTFAPPFHYGVLREHRSYWKHTIRDEDDLNAHINYIHINPLKHGLVSAVINSPWSSFHRYVRTGIYPSDWGGKGEVIVFSKQGYEKVTKSQLAFFPRVDSHKTEVV